MKTLISKLKSSLLILSFLVTNQVWSNSPVGQVKVLRGEIFSIYESGKTIKLNKNSQLVEASEILVSEGSELVFTDYYDTTYHLTSGTHVKLYDKSIQLKAGMLKISSQHTKPLSLVTSNALVDYWLSDAVIIFDSLANKTEVLVAKGQVNVANILNSELKVSVDPGYFTVLDSNIDEGLPRNPTLVGVNSLKKILDHFEIVSPSIEYNKMPIKREIASVKEEQKESSVPRGKIIFIKTTEKSVPMGRSPASVEPSKLKKKKVDLKHKSSGLKINIYGQNNLIQSTTGRAPASVPKIQEESSRIPASETLRVNNEFKESLEQFEKKQPKHTKEVQNLLNDLKSLD